MDYFAIALSIISAIGVVVSVFATYKKSKKEDTTQIKITTEKDLLMRTDLEYIKRRADESAVVQKQIIDKIDNQGERITRVEESVKSAHKRIDTIEDKI